MKRNEGNATFMGILLTFLSSLVLIGSIVIYQNSLDRIKRRSQSYLCLKYYAKKGKSYVKQMGLINQAIRAANTASLVPAATVVAQKAVKALKATQDILHLFLITTLTTTSNCSYAHSLLLMASLPYRTKGIVKLKRAALGTTIVRKRRWKLNLPSKDGHLLWAKFILKSKYSTNLGVESGEMPFLKHSFGFP